MLEGKSPVGSGVDEFVLGEESLEQLLVEQVAADQDGIPMGLGSAGHWIDLSYNSCSPRQFVRELVQNGIEAGATEIWIEPDWAHVHFCVRSGRDPIYRFSVWDNGRGMGPGELRNHLSKLFNSGGKLMLVGSNHGMGARVSLLPASPEGTIWMSWQNGVGYMVKFVKDSQGQYVLQPWRTQDGNVVPVIRTPSEYNTNPHTGLPREHGTLVIALGKSHVDHSLITLGKQGFSGGRQYMQAINHRYWRVPRDVSIRVWQMPGSKSGGVPDPKEDGWPKRCSRTRSSSRGGAYRECPGAQYYFVNEVYESTGNLRGNKYLQDQGRFDLGAGCSVEWFTYKGDRDSYGRFQCHMASSYTIPPGSVCLVYKNEIYKVLRGVGSFKRFGIVYSEAVQRMAIAIHVPDTWHTDASRSQVFPDSLGEKDVPWGEFGEVFFHKVFKSKNSAAPAIKDLVDEVRGGDTDNDKITERIATKLDDFLLEWGMKREVTKKSLDSGEEVQYRYLCLSCKNRFQHTLVNGASCPSCGALASRVRSGGGTSGGSGESGCSRRQTKITKPEIVLNDVDKDVQFPVDWDPGTNQLVLNTQHIFFQEVFEKVSEGYTQTGADDIIWDAIKFTYGMHVAEKIIYTHVLRRHWGSYAEYEKLITPHALTMACVDFSLALKTIRQITSGSLGRKM